MLQTGSCYNPALFTECFLPDITALILKEIDSNTEETDCASVEYAEVTHCEKEARIISSTMKEQKCGEQDSLCKNRSGMHYPMMTSITT